MSAAYEEVPRKRRGAALLLVLATLVLVVGGTASLARLAGTGAARRALARRLATADDLCIQGEAVARDWLARSADGCVLAPDVWTPEVPVLHDTWILAGIEHELRVTAWDQNGMVPHELAHGGSPLRSVLPAEVRSLLDRAGGGLSGLDQLDQEGAPSPFALPGPSLARSFGEGSPPFPPAVPSLRGLSAGAWIGTHPAGSRRINVNTAPWPLVEAALRLAGAGDGEAIRAAREKLVLASVAAGAAPPSGPILVPRSDAWAFRIDATVARLTRSWWSVYHRQDGEWTLVQRLLIRR